MAKAKANPPCTAWKKRSEPDRAPTCPDSGGARQSVSPRAYGKEIRIPGGSGCSCLWLRREGRREEDMKEGTTSAAGRAGQSRLPSLSSLAVRSFARERGRFLEGLILSPPPDGRTDAPHAG